VREIQGHPREIHGIDVLPDLIGTLTDAVPDRGWRMAELAAGAGIGLLAPPVSILRWWFA
jgi:hypothetical protein